MPSSSSMRTQRRCAKAGTGVDPLRLASSHKAQGMATARENLAHAGRPGLLALLNTRARRWQRSHIHIGIRIARQRFLFSSSPKFYKKTCQCHPCNHNNPARPASGAGCALCASELCVRASPLLSWKCLLCLCGAACFFSRVVHPAQGPLRLAPPRLRLHRRALAEHAAARPPCSTSPGSSSRGAGGRPLVARGCHLTAPGPTPRSSWAAAGSAGRLRGLGSRVRPCPT